LNIIPFTNKEKYLQNVGVCYLYKGDINNAIVYYEKAYKKYINSPQNELITYLYILKGDYNAAAERGSDYAIYAQKGDWEKTVVSLENKIKKSPSGTVIDKKTYNGTPDLYLNLAIAYKMIGKQDKALENLNIAIKIKPKQELRYREIFNKYNKLYHDYFDKFAYEI
jgi:tetratricopeptide (TPR) repeat protein